jgi:hypothetical protein
MAQHWAIFRLFHRCESEPYRDAQDDALTRAGLRLDPFKIRLVTTTYQRLPVRVGTPLKLKQAAIFSKE